MVRTGSASMNARNWVARYRSYRRRNQPWPSAMTSAEVTSAGGEEKRRLNAKWWVSDLSRNAMNAEVSRYASKGVCRDFAVSRRCSVLRAIHEFVDGLAGARIAGSHESRILHPCAFSTNRQMFP